MMTVGQLKAALLDAPDDQVPVIVISDGDPGVGIFRAEWDLASAVWVNVTEDGEPLRQSVFVLAVED